ncbi:MAG: hypothetical protein AB3X44_18890 [Leptothrix sp. (in: b-proteobacteria)]
MNYLLVLPPSLGDVNHLAMVWQIIRSLDSNPHFPEPWLAQVPPPAELKAGYQTLNDADHAALSRDKVKIELRNAARDHVEDMIKRGRAAPRS